MFRNKELLNRRPGLLDPRTKEAYERLSAFRAGTYVFVFAGLFLAAALAATVVGFPRLVLTLGGISLALAMVGALLVFASGRTRRRDPRRRLPVYERREHLLKN